MNTPSEAATTKTFRLSKRLTVEITVGPAGMVCEWAPTMPKTLTAAELKAYRLARHEMLEHLAGRLGGGVVCVEL